MRDNGAAAWRLPAGQVESRETLEAALTRILKISSGIVLEGSPALFAIYPNHKLFPADHLAFYVVRLLAKDMEPAGLEKTRSDYYALDKLPADLGAETAARIRAVIESRVAEKLC